MAATASGIRMGKAFVELFINDMSIGKTLDNVRKQLDNFGKFTIKMGAAVGGIGGAILTPLMGMFGKAAERGHAIQGMAEQFGTSVGTISNLASAFEGAGVSFDSFADSLDGLSSKILDNDQLLMQMGVHTMALAQQPIDKQFDDVADALARMTNPARRAQFAMQIFGTEVGRKLRDYLKDGAAGLKRFKEENAGMNLDPDTAKRATATMQGLNQIWTVFNGTLLDVGSALLPSVDSIRHVVQWIKQAGIGLKDWISQNKETIKVVAGVAAGLVVAGGALVTFGTIAVGVGATIGLITTVVGGIAAALSSIPAMASVAAVAMGGYFLSQTQSGQTALGSLRQGFLDIKDTIVTAWDGIGQAIGKGDFVLGFKIAVASMELIWAQAVARMKDAWSGVSFSIGGSMVSVINALRVMWNNFAAWLSKNLLGPIFKTIAEGIGWAVKQFDEKKGKQIQADAEEKFGDAAIERKRAAREKEIMLEDSETHKFAEAGREGPDLSEVNRLKDVLDGLKKEAAKGKEMDWKGSLLASMGAFAEKRFGVGGNALPNPNDVMGMGTSVKGGFSAVAAAQQFGVGDKTDRIIEGINTTNQRLDTLNGTMKDIGTGLRMK